MKSDNTPPDKKQAKAIQEASEKEKATTEKATNTADEEDENPYGGLKGKNNFNRNLGCGG